MSASALFSWTPEISQARLKWPDYSAAMCAPLWAPNRSIREPEGRVQLQPPATLLTLNHSRMLNHSFAKTPPADLDKKSGWF